MIRAIAEELHLGLDAFVFIDDSPVECAEVASALPMVEVIQMPREAHRVPSVLASYRGFDRSSVTREDGLRTTHHAAEREREQARAQYADLDAFLASLDLEAVVGPPSPAELERVAQLTARTNQFNLTTRRYDLFDIESLAKSPRSLVVALRASDRHGDYGLTGLGIATVDPAPIDSESDDRSPLVRIDALLMSCRTLGRKLEDVLLSELCAAIDARFPGARIEAEYRPTKKNAQVADFYAKHGFVREAAVHPGDPQDGELAGPRTYVLAGTKPAPPSFIRIRRIP
jgi:FkbH-like protein